MKIINKNEFGKLKVDELDKFESSLTNQLPSDFKEFLIANNSCKVSPNYFFSEEIESSIHGYMFGLHEGESIYQLTWYSDMFYRNEKVDLVPFAGDPCGNHLCLLLKESSSIVVFHDHETDETHHLADSFNEFLELLVPEPMTDFEAILANDNLPSLVQYIQHNQFDPNSLDEYNRNLLEQATIKGALNIVRYLLELYVDKRNALALAEQNARFFDKHKPIVELLLRK